VFTTVAALGGVPRTDLERTLNMGVGFVAVLPAASVDAARAHLTARGIGTWVMGEVAGAEAAEHATGEVVRGAKGVDGGSVELVGDHPRG
jgi:phosphoribosylformylglycinamidine cyclo-ligase